MGMMPDTGGPGGILTTIKNAVVYLGQLVGLLQDIDSQLKASFPQVTGTAATATAGAATLPANPVGFVTVLLPDGSTVKLPYYSN